MSVSALQKALEPIGRRIRLLAGRAIINMVNDTGAFQLHQVERLADEIDDGLERFSEYGLASRPPTGAEAIVISLGGVRSHGVIIGCEHRQYRLKGLASGDVALYDDQGQVIKLGRDGITITTTLPASISAASLTIDADTTIEGTLTVTGDVALQANTHATGDLTVDGNSDLGGAGSLAVKRSDNSNATKVKAK